MQRRLTTVAGKRKEHSEPTYSDSPRRDLTADRSTRSTRPDSNSFVPNPIILKPNRLVPFLLITLLASTLRGQEATTQAQESEPAANPVAVEEIVDDQAINQRLTQILESRQRYADVDVRVSNGVVTFEGQAASAEDRQWVEDLAERTEGVVVVDNQIDVEAVVNIDSNLQVIEASLSSLWRDFLSRLPLMVAALVVLVITAIAAKTLGVALRRMLLNRRVRSSLKDLMQQFATLGVWIVGVVIAAVIVFPGLTPAKALTVLGLGSVAIGFAFKDIFENFFAGVLILWRYPLDRGDFIQCDGDVGQVEEITVRNTLLRRLDGELTVIPNAHLFKSSVDVLTNRKFRRVRLICGVAYDTDVAQARRVIDKAVHSCASVESDRPIEVFAQEFASSSINFEVVWWTGATPLEIRASRDEVVEAIKTALDEASIEIPFPYRTLTFKEPLSLLQRSRDDVREPETIGD